MGEDGGQRWRCTGRKGALLREGAALDSAECGDVAAGAVVAVRERATVGDRERWRVVSDDGRSLTGWASAKLFSAVEAVPPAPAREDAPAAETSAAPAVRKKRPNKAAALKRARAYVASRMGGGAHGVEDAALAGAWAAVGVPDLALALREKAGDAESAAELAGVVGALDAARNVLFPRQTPMHETRIDAGRDGVVVSDGRLDGRLGFRTWRFADDASSRRALEGVDTRPHGAAPPLLILFHGNGETASEYDVWAPVYLRIGVRLAVVDFAGYGWSAGGPSRVSTLLSDAHETLYGLGDLRRAAGVPADAPLILFGRSMGSIPACHLAAVAPPGTFAGVVIESGIATGIAGRGAAMETEDKLAAAAAECPVLVIHGEADAIVPLANAARFLERRPAARLLTLNAGHNDLLLDPANGKAYFSAIRLLVRAALGGPPLPAVLPGAVGARARPPGPFGALA